MCEIIRLNDYRRRDHGCIGNACPLCRPLRTVAEVLSLRAAREAKHPVDWPADTEGPAA